MPDTWYEQAHVEAVRLGWIEPGGDLDAWALTRADTNLDEHASVGDSPPPWDQIMFTALAGHDVPPVDRLAMAAVALVMIRREFRADCPGEHLPHGLRSIDEFVSFCTQLIGHGGLTHSGVELEGVIRMRRPCVAGSQPDQGAPQ